MPETTNPQPDRRERYAAAIRETDGWVLDDGQHMIAAVIAVADAEQAELRERHKASLRRAGEINNRLMEEVQRYAAGAERPVLWSVYNRMHTRALNAEAEVKRVADGRAVVDRKVVEQVREIVRRLANHAVGFGDVLDESDRGPWGAMVGADIAALQTAVAAVPVAEATNRAALREPADRAAILREAADICDEAGAVYASKELNDQAGVAYRLMERFLRKADEAEYVATPCSLGGCEPGGEPCSTHERLMAHAEGDHELCEPDCGPSRVAGEAPQPETQADAQGALLATRCDACRHTLNWHRNDVGCTVALCVCGRFQDPAVVSQPGKEG